MTTKLVSYPIVEKFGLWMVLIREEEFPLAEQVCHMDFDHIETAHKNFRYECGRFYPDNPPVRAWFRDVQGEVAEPKKWCGTCAGYDMDDCYDIVGLCVDCNKWQPKKETVPVKPVAEPVEHYKCEGCVDYPSRLNCNHRTLTVDEDGEYYCRSWTNCKRPVTGQSERPLIQVTPKPEVAEPVKNLNVKGIVVTYLKDNGYDGLYCPDVPCGCELSNLAPCGCECWADCLPGVKKKYKASDKCGCDGEGTDHWHIQPRKTWYCMKCGAPCDTSSGEWRFNGQAWEHYHGYPWGHVLAEKREVK